MKPIQIRYYEKTDEQKKRFISYMKHKIKKGDNPLLKQMMEVVEKKVKHYHSDFYVHDVALVNNSLSERKNFLWIVRELGTNFIDLYDEQFRNGEWETAGYFEAILFNLDSSSTKNRTLYYGMVETYELKQISEKQAHFILKQYEENLRFQMKSAIV